MEAKMTKSAQQLRGGTLNRCAVCGGKLRAQRLSAARQDFAGEPQPIRHESGTPRDPASRPAARPRGRGPAVGEGRPLSPSRDPADHRGDCAEMRGVFDRLLTRIKESR